MRRLIVLAAFALLGVECGPQTVRGLLGNVHYEMAGLIECEFLCVPAAVAPGRSFRYGVFDVDVEVNVTSSDESVVLVTGARALPHDDGTINYSITMWAQSPGTAQIQLWDEGMLVDVLEATVAPDGLE